MRHYNKPYLAIPEQLSLLESRGLAVTDRPKAEHYLSKIGYYRLSGYSYVFRKIAPNAAGTTHKVLDDFKGNVKFDDILALYVFDKRMRLALLDAIERIEVALRVDVALQLGKHDSEAHLDPVYLYDTFSVIPPGATISKFQDWQKKYQKAVNESREDFVEHFRTKYPACDLPIWIATELWDFGMLSKYISNMKDMYKKPIAEQYDLHTIRLLGSWLHTINVIRNICAHHGRLWNRVMSAKPQYPKSSEAALLRPMVENSVPSNRIFAAMCIVQYFMRFISPNSNWHRRVVELVDGFPNSPHINSSMMGTQEGWQSWQLWE